MRTEKLTAGIEVYGIPVTDEALTKFERFYALLIEKNQVMNLTAITNWDEVVEKHFLDSLSLLKVHTPEELVGKKILDLGTGAGFPGIPLKIVLPSLSITFVDSLQKRVGFLSEVMEELSFSEASAIHGRAEDLGQDTAYRECFDLVLSRAVANLSTLSEYGLPFVKVGGEMICYKSKEIEEELTQASGAVKRLGGAAPVVTKFTVPHTELFRSLVTIPKETATPKAYPRKAGTPAKKPLQ